MDVTRTRVTPDARLVVAAAFGALLLSLLFQVWSRPLAPADIRPADLNAPTIAPAETAPAAPSFVPKPAITVAPAGATPAGTSAPADAPASVAPSAPATTSRPPADATPANPNLLAPMDGEVPSIVPKVPPPPKG